MALRVLHCPVNLAGVGWTNVQALRRKGVDARLLLYARIPSRPDEFDIYVERPEGLWRRQPVQLRTLAAVLPETDIFHFYCGLTLVPRKLQFPILRATRRKSVFHFLGADIRETPREKLGYGLKADARIVGSYAALRFIPFDAHVVPPGIEVHRYEPAPPSESDVIRIVHAPSNKEKKGTEFVVKAVEDLKKRYSVELDVVHGVRNEDALARYRRADIIVDQLLRDWHGVFAIEAMALGKPVVTSLDDDAVRQTEKAFGLELPILAATKDDLAEKLAWLIERPEERMRRGAAGRAYVEHVHDVDQMADRLLVIYNEL
ncbi:MAG TPA: glycosyltransferase family 4 protein [Gaiellaceae bacterium]